MAPTLTEAVASVLLLPLYFVLLFLFAVVLGFFQIIFVLVKFVVEWYSEGRLQILSGFDSFFFSENDDNKMITCAVFDGHYNIKGVEDFKKFMLTGRNKNGCLIAANFLTLSEQKYGFVFKRKNPNFNINDHFLESPRVLKSKSDMKEVISEEFKKEWAKNKPQWFVTLYKITDSSETGKKSSKQSLLIFSMSHSLTDGLSLLLAVYELAKSINKNMKDMRSLKFKIVNNYLEAFLNTIFFSPLYCMKCFFKSDNKFFKSNRISKEGLFSFLDTLHGDRVKAIAKATRTFDFAIYTSCFAAAIHKYIKTSGSNSFGDMLTAFPVSFQKPEDPLILSNKIFGIYMWLPVGEMKVLERLKEITRRINNIKNSPIPIYAKILNDLVSKCPKFIREEFFHSLTPGIVLTVCPDFKEDKQFIFGQELIEIFGGLFSHRNSGNVVINYVQGRPLVGLTVNRNVFKTQEDADRFLRYFEEEFQSLEEIVNEENKKLA